MENCLIREVTIVKMYEYVDVSDSVCKKPWDQEMLPVEKTQKENNSLGKKQVTLVKNKNKV